MIALAGTVLAIMCWFHFAVAGVAILSVVIFALFRRELLGAVAAAVGIAILLFSPWLVHVVANWQFLHTGASSVTAFVPLFSVIAACLGAMEAWKSKEREPLAIVSIILACGVFLIALRERFWTYGGYSFAILGG